MDLILLPQHWSAILCICIMIGALIFAAIKKYMMTYALIVANFVIFIITVIFEYEIVYGLNGEVFQYAGLGFRSIYLNSELFPQIYTIFTSMFIHGGFAHIFGNMIILFFVGIPFEQRIGWKKFIVIYLIAGVVGTLTHSFINPDSVVPLIGASGAIFGIMGAFAFSYPHDKVIMPIGIGIMFLTKIKVVYAVMFFAVLETVIVFLDVQDTTAHFAHLGGLIGGMILAAILIKRPKRKDDPFDTNITYSYDSDNKPFRDNLSSLKPLATTPELKDMLKKIESESVPQVRDIWLEHFVEKAVCPKCGDKLFHLNHKIWCDKCGFKTKF